MNIEPYFLRKIKVKKLKCLLQFLFGYVNLHNLVGDSLLLHHVSSEKDGSLGVFWKRKTHIIAELYHIDLHICGNLGRINSRAQLFKALLS